MMGLRQDADQQLGTRRIRGWRVLWGILGAAVMVTGPIGCHLTADRPGAAVTGISSPASTSTAPVASAAPSTPSPSSPGALRSPTTGIAGVTPSPTPSPQPTATPPSSATATASAKPSPVARSANSALFRAAAGDFGAGDVVGVEASPSGLTLVAVQGQYTSPVQEAAIPFNNAVLSWAADAPAGASLKLELRVRVGASWSRWYTMGTWSNGHGASSRGQSDAYGQVDIDTLELNQPAQAFQYRVTLSSSQSGLTPVVRSVTVAYADLRAPLAGSPVALQPNWVRDLPVPQISQAVQDPTIRWQICSPTSLTMVLGYWGQNKSLMDVVGGVRDQTAGIYGNWALNAAYAATLGFDSHVARFYCVEQLQNEIAQGRPVVVSLNYGAGQLSGAPLDSTSGHLIVVRGFTANGDVIVNDPAAPTHGSVRRVYQRDQFAHVWLSSGGVAYVIAPADSR